MIKGYIFDLDGVIVDTAMYHFAAWRKLANTLGFDITEAQNENLKGVSRKESLEYILSLGELHFSRREQLKMAALKNKWYVESISEMNPSELLPGAQKLLEEIKNAGFKISLGYASKNSLRILNSTNIIHLFDVIIDGTKTTKSKPDPQVFLMGAEALNLNPQECIVFEDSKNGIKAANDGGFISVGIGDVSILNEASVVYPSLEKLTLAKLENLDTSPKGSLLKLTTQIP